MGQGGLRLTCGPWSLYVHKELFSHNCISSLKDLPCVPCSSLETNNITQGLASATAEQGCKGLPGLTL